MLLCLETVSSERRSLECCRSPSTPGISSKPSCRRCDSCDWSEPPASDPVGAVPVIVQAPDAHVLARLPGVDEAPVADVDAVVAQPVEEDEIAWLEVVARDRRPVLVLHRSVVGERNSDLRIDIADEARAIEAGRRLAAPSIRRTAVLHRKVH